MTTKQATSFPPRLPNLRARRCSKRLLVKPAEGEEEKGAWTGSRGRNWIGKAEGTAAAVAANAGGTETEKTTTQDKKHPGHQTDDNQGNQGDMENQGDQGSPGELQEERKNQGGTRALGEPHGARRGPRGGPTGAGRREGRIDGRISGIRAEGREY